MLALHTLETRLKRTVGDLIERRLLNACTIVMRYVDAVATAGGFDRNDESTYPAREEKTSNLGGFVHFVSARTTARQFTEIQTGDAIVTFEASVDFTGKDKIRFELTGPTGGAAETYVQAAVGKELAQYWDVVLGGYPITQTVLLRKAT